jgi:hypothetical protein
LAANRLSLAPVKIVSRFAGGDCERQMSAHRINLRGPWKLELGTDAAATALKVRLPAEWSDLFASHSGRVRLSRTFHRPTNLQPTDVVELVFDQWPGAWAVSLNQEPIGKFRDASAGAPTRIAVTRFLQPTNVLAVESEIAAESERDQSRGQFGTVAIEIRSE